MKLELVPCLSVEQIVSGFIIWLSSSIISYFPWCIHPEVLFQKRSQFGFFIFDFLPLVSLICGMWI